MSTHNYVYIMLEDMDEEACESMAYAYGIFNNDTLVGYCTLGSGIGVLDDIRQASETVVLSDVYILDGYRNCGLGSKLVKEAIEQKLKNDPTIKNVFLTILDIDLNHYQMMTILCCTCLVKKARICYTNYT